MQKQKYLLTDFTFSKENQCLIIYIKKFNLACAVSPSPSIRIINHTLCQTSLQARLLRNCYWRCLI